MEDIKKLIIAFIQENFIAGRSTAELGMDDSLLDSGIIDSTGILELVLFIEENFSIKIEDEEIIPENLDTISNMLSFIEKKRQSVKAAS
jgi:acyl carrier protein